MAVYVMNPLLGDINPGTDVGAKLYSKATAERESKLSVSQKNEKDILQAFKKDASNFGWGPLVGLIQVDAAGTERNILTDLRRMTVEMVQKTSRRVWMALAPAIPWADPMPTNFNVPNIDPAANAAQRPQFFRHTHSQMIAKRIKHSLDKASLASLMLERNTFEWMCADGTIVHNGPTMLFLILSKINPLSKSASPPSNTTCLMLPWTSLNIMLVSC